MPRTAPSLSLVDPDRRRQLAAAGALLLGAALPGLSRPARAAAPLRVVASFSILADLLREIGGALVEVQALVGPNADVHVFEPRPADLRLVARADLVVGNGLNFEPWLARLLRAAEYKGATVSAAEGITPRRSGAMIDPHAWHDLRLAQQYVSRLTEALAQLRPDAAAELRRRGADYAGRLDALDRQLRSQLAALPPQARRVMTTHDAFGYLGAAYGIEFLAPQGWSTESEPSAAQVAALIRQLRARQVKALFLESGINPRLLQRIAAEGGASIGGTLYADALSAPGGPADTFLKLVQHNSSTLLAALRG
ncbi:MAG: hypothetical protein RJA44_1342 [Pseudomonadota bacterium]|jgi:zinc/manganese transport system substrate-binding protein